MASPTRLHSSPHYSDPEWRNVFPLPLADKFYDLLQDRLHTVVENILFQGDTRFTLLINAISRKEQQKYKRVDSPEFIYAGLKKQRELLNRNAMSRWEKEYEHSEAVEDAWYYLGETTIVQENSEVSNSFYQQTKKGELSLQDACKIQDLKSYFGEGTSVYTAEMQAEFAILSEPYFDIEEDLFIPVPLFGFAEFDGVVYVIFKRALLEKFQKPVLDHLQVPASLMWVLLRAFIVEYDGLFLDWDMEGENIEKISAIHEFIDETILRKEEYELIAYADGKPNKILIELGVREYYLHHREYFRTRLESGKDVPGKIYQQYITHAVSSILIDSYAHNVSAHALSTLAWWYFLRAKFLREEEVDWDALLLFLRAEKREEEKVDPALLNQLEKALSRRRQAREERLELKRVAPQAIRTEDGAEVIRYPGSLAREIAQLLRFLTEKGAYWSGVTRDANVGGKVDSLYTVLWYDFIRNPLFVGTIAKTEDILKISFRVILYDTEPAHQRDNDTLYHAKSFQPENEGEFAFVDLGHPREDAADPDAFTHDDMLSAFVRKGAQFKQLRPKMKDIKIFFPGGIIGRHAFFTMIENEIRNIKHYKSEDLKTLQKNGLTVAIGVEPCSLHGSKGQEIYRISIWLDTPTRLGDNDANHLMRRRWDMLKGDIIHPDTHAPQLGGSYQDKVCAGFLFNGFFSHVQRGDRNPNREKRHDTPRDRNYFPWIRPACSALSTEPNPHFDYKVSYNNPKATEAYDPDDQKAPIEVKIHPVLPAVGYSKKVFYVWRGENLVDWPSVLSEEAEDNLWDNPSRYTIVNLSMPDETFEKLRHKRGVVRIVDGAPPAETDTDAGREQRFFDAYTLWVSRLLKREFFILDIHEELTPYFQLVLEHRDDGVPVFHVYTTKDRSAIPSFDENKALHYLTEENKLYLAHKTDEQSQRGSTIRFRSHGTYRTYFLGKNLTAPLSILQKKLRMLELFETLATRICIFDNRLYHRLRVEEQEGQKIDPFRTLLRDKLKLGIYNEALDSSAVDAPDCPAWLTQLAQPDRDFVRNCHFLVMHLSFIEAILDRRERKDKAGNVGYFIDRYLIPFIGQRDNFFLVITTGRGRNEWSGKIEQEYKGKGYTRFVLFRPVESLLSVMENAINMHDDVELKYRLTKVLYGS